MGKPAARVTDLLSNAGMITGPGAPTVLINGLPAARVGDMHATPMVIPGTPPIPMVGGPVIGPGCPTTLIVGMPAAVMGDMAATVGPPGTIILGSPNVLIGMSAGGGGGGGGGGSSAAQNKVISGLKNGTIKPVKGSESFPIPVQVEMLQAAKYYSEAEVAEIVEMKREKLEKKTLTIADIVEILKVIEKEEGYEAARFFAWHLDYLAINRLAERFINGDDTNPDNNPNLMPTRFMVLYGADDAKLKTIDDHPDKAEKEEHKINVANIRKALNLMGHKVDENGPFDDELQNAFWDYLGRDDGTETDSAETHVVKDNENLGTIAKKYDLRGWKYLYEINKQAIGENPDLVKPGTELKIPQWDSTSGDEKLKAKKVRVNDWVGGTSYRYPWVKYSVTMSTRSGDIYKEKRSSGEEQTAFVKKKKYEVHDGDTGLLLATGEIGASEELDLLVPDVKNFQCIIDGIEYEPWNGEA